MLSHLGTVVGLTMDLLDRNQRSLQPLAHMFLTVVWFSVSCASIYFIATGS